MPGATRELSNSADMPRVSDLAGTELIPGMRANGQPIAIQIATLLPYVRSTDYKGAWDADTNTPTIPPASDANRGQYYMVSVAGDTSINGIATWGVGDIIVSRGTAWERIPISDAFSDIADKEPRISGEVPTDDDPRFGILDKDGDELFAFVGNWVRIARLLLGSTEWADTDRNTAPISISDLEGNVVFQTLLNGLVGVNGLEIGGARIVWNPKLSAAIGFTDAEGNVAFALQNSGVVEFTGQGSTPPDGTSQNVTFAFVEPWTDPSKDAVVTWLSDSESKKAMEYQVDGASVWQAVSSQRSRPFPNAPGLFLHSAFLHEVSPDTLYHLRWPGAAKTEKFRSAPRQDVRIIFPSDYQQYNFGEGGLLYDFGQVAQEEKPHLIVMNGDYVDDDGVWNETNSARWRGFLAGLSAYYRRDEALIPMIATMGNHEGRNAGDTSNAIAGGDGTPGPIIDIFSFLYDPENPNINFRSNGHLSVGRELLVVTLETDFTVPLPSQLPWFQAVLAAEVPKHRNVIVVGHAPAFCGMGLYDFGHFDNQARAMRNLFWPAMEPYADKIRFVIGGHEHILAVTDKLRMDYDPGMSLVENDTRWAVDAVNGVRQIGNGPWGATRLDLDFTRTGELSTVDGSAKMIAAMGYKDAAVQVFGSGVTNATAETWNVWVADFSADQWATRALGRAGQQFYSISEGN